MDLFSTIDKDSKKKNDSDIKAASTDKSNLTLQPVSNNNSVVKTSYANNKAFFDDVLNNAPKDNLYYKFVADNYHELIFFEKDINKLVAIINSPRPHHAYRLIAPIGSNSLTFIYEVLFSLYVKEYKTSIENIIDDSFIMRCISLSHPDILLISSDNSNITIDSQNKMDINVQQIKDINRFLQKQSFELKQKIVIINAIDNLNLNAANALLKAVEEPIGNTIFFIVNYNQNIILQTIKSRCFNFHINRFSFPVFLEYIENTQPSLAEVTSHTADSISFIYNNFSYGHIILLQLLNKNIYNLYVNILDIFIKNNNDILIDIIKKSNADVSYCKIILELLNILILNSLKSNSTSHKLSENETIAHNLILEYHNSQYLFYISELINKLSNNIRLLNIDHKLILPNVFSHLKK